MRVASGEPFVTDTVVGRSVLFVDDDALVRKAWSALLEREGWNVTQAGDGEEAWALFQARVGQWCVVLTDLAMPNLDGHGLAMRIRDMSEAPPVVLMSGHVGVDEEHQRFAQHFAAVLLKPVDPDELIRVLNASCRASPLKAQVQASRAAVSLDSDEQASAPVS